MIETDDLLFDLVVCVGPNDNNIVDQVIPYMKKNVKGYRNIYLICSNPNISIPYTITIDEKIFPFSKEDVSSIFGKMIEMVGIYNNY